MTTSQLEDAQPQERLALYLSEKLVHGTDTHNIERMAQALGYAHTTTIKMWIDKRAKVPLRQITPIAHFLGVEIAEILPYWLSQECPDDEHLYRAGKRMLSVWEWMLVSVARDVYGVDE